MLTPRIMHRADTTCPCDPRQVGYCLKVADTLASEGIECEVINLRSIRPLDRATILTSARKTHRVVGGVRGSVGWGVGGVGGSGGGSWVWG